VTPTARRLAFNLLLLAAIPAALLCRAFIENVVAREPTTREALASIGAAIEKAKSTFPATQIPQMCVAFHPTTPPEQNLALIKKLGATCARTDNGWDQIEREIGVYDWKEADAIWLPLCKAHIRPIMIATYNNPLYAAGVFRAIAGKPNVDAFAKFSAAMADHYVKACPDMIIELFNEPNAVNWTTVPWSGASYATMLAPVSAAIKKAQPHVIVFSGGLGFDAQSPTRWVSDMVRTGEGLPAVDVYAFHPYNYDEGTPVKTLPPEQLLVDTTRFADHTKASAKPIALTEYGFPLKALGGDLKRQGFYTARAMLAAIIGHYSLQTIYDLVDDGTDYTNVQNTFGLFHTGISDLPYEIKPSGLAFTTIARAMADAKSVTLDYDAAQMMPTLTFEKTQDQTLAVWTLDTDGAKTFSKPIASAKKPSCTNTFGKPYPCRYQDGILSFSFTETDAPILVTLAR